jgi:hypothetical protein
MIAHVDLDFVKYGAASVGERRYIIVTHKTTGRSKEFDNRTQFYGRGKNKDGGWLGELNATRDSPFTFDEFDIEDKQEITEPVQNILHSAKLMVEGNIKASGASSFHTYIGKGESFRRELSTLLEYKGNRTDLVAPLLLNDVMEYLTKKFKPELVIGLEVDDAVTIATYDKPDHFIIGADKDFRGAGTRFFDVNNPEEGIIDCTGFGSIWDTGKKISGKGRLFKYWQALSNDVSDNYKANCFSDTKWADKSAYKALVNCQNDKEAWQVLVDSFKLLYPEPKIITGWRGDEIMIDWQYVMQEMFNMAHMHRWKDDYINVGKVIEKMGIIT